jgi:hypothetical protein
MIGFWARGRPARSGLDGAASEALTLHGSQRPGRLASSVLSLRGGLGRLAKLLGVFGGATGGLGCIWLSNQLRSMFLFIPLVLEVLQGRLDWFLNPLSATIFSIHYICPLFFFFLFRSVL